MGKKIAAVVLALLLVALPLAALAQENPEELFDALPEAAMVVSIADSLPARSAILMEQGTGQILYEQNADEQLPPASVTKVMTLLLVMEALESGKINLTDTVTASENAASMGGSQIWLKVGEQMTVDELLKAVAISSANDASVALAEHVAGSEEAFIDMMNSRALDLGMENTHFLNCTGLDEAGHLTTARDIALMSRVLIQHPLISEYSTIWMDSLRGGETELVNTNRLVRFYNGATGLKTGTTSGAGSCLSATATRDNLSLVAVVMGCGTSDERFSSARGLLDYGFANYMSMTPPPVDSQLAPIRVIHGTRDSVMPVYDTPGSFVVEKISEDAITQQISLPEDVQAPVMPGQVLGQVEILVDGTVVGSYPLKAGSGVEAMTFPNAFKALWTELLRMNDGPKAQRIPAPEAPAEETVTGEETWEVVAIAEPEEAFYQEEPEEDSAIDTWEDLEDEEEEEHIYAEGDVDEDGWEIVAVA